MKQFCCNAQNADKKKSFLTVQETEEAKKLLFKRIQHEQFGTDLLALTQNQPLLKKSKLLSLIPFSIATTLVGVHLNRLMWFPFLIFEGGLLNILIDCMIFLSPFLDVTMMYMSIVSFLAQLDSGILCL